MEQFCSFGFKSLLFMFFRPVRRQRKLARASTASSPPYFLFTHKYIINVQQKIYNLLYFRFICFSVLFQLVRRMTVPSSSYYHFSLVISDLTSRTEGLPSLEARGCVVQTIACWEQSCSIHSTFKLLVFVFSRCSFHCFPTIVLPKVICCEFCTCVYTVVCPRFENIRYLEFAF